MKPVTRRYYEEAVERAVQDVTAGLDDALDLAALSRRAALSPLHFHRIFRGLTGETPLEMHRRLRLERAAWELVHGDAAITRIAFEAGYETHESFTRAFREAYDASPSEFRTRTRAKEPPWAAPTAITLAAPSGVHFTATGASSIPVFRTGGSTMEVSVEEVPEKRVLAVAHRGPYNTISEAFARLDGIARSAGLLKHPGLELVALYYDDPEITPVAELRADAGLVVPRGIPCPPGLHEISIPAGTYARTVHEGPYPGLGDTWARLMGGWLVTSGHRVGDGPSYERYLNTPINAAPHELRTELYVSLARSAPRG